MTEEEEKQLLMVDLCARLPYGVKVSTNRGPELIEGLWPFGFYDIKIAGNIDWWYLDFKPYLRPMSSMTEEEKEVYDRLIFWKCQTPVILTELKVLDWLNEHHFDYRGLIPMGLALEAPKDMYKF